MCHNSVQRMSSQEGIVDKLIPQLSLEKSKGYEHS